MINGRVSPDGALYVLQKDAPDGALAVGGQAMSDAGVLYVGNVGPMGSVALDPATIATRVWYDPSDISTMFLDSAGTVPAQPVGTVADQPIELLLDKSGRGAHQVQPDNAKAPILSARVNLLLASENYSSPVWADVSGVVIAGKQISFAPEGIFYQRRPVAAAPGQTFIGKVRLSGTVGGVIVFRSLLVDGAVEQQSSLVITLTDTPTEYTLSAPVATAATDVFLGLDNRVAIGSPALPVVVVAEWLSLAYSSDSSLPYQYVNTAADYDAAGFPHYLIGNGTSTSMGSAATLDLTNTNSVAVFTGLEKADDIISIVSETSINTNNNVGSFYQTAGSDGSTFDYSTSFRGTVTNSISDVRPYPGLDRCAMTSLMRLGAPFKNQTRRNGVAGTDNLGDCGATPFGNYPLFLMARNNSAAYLTGKFYQFILLDYMPDESTIKGLEQYVNTKIGGKSYWFPNSYLTDQNGTVMVGPPPIVGYKGGLPYNAKQELVVQLNQPVSPGDSYVGGIRVGPLGGVYVIDTTPPPPPPLRGFSDGFDGGF